MSRTKHPGRGARTKWTRDGGGAGFQGVQQSFGGLGVRLAIDQNRALKFVKYVGKWGVLVKPVPSFNDSLPCEKQANPGNLATPTCRGATASGLISRFLFFSFHRVPCTGWML